jgi:hypothetical protein
VRARTSDDNVWVNYQLGDLEQGLSEYIVAAGLQSGQPLFESVNSLGTAVTGRAIRKRAKAAGFLTSHRMLHLAGNRHHDLPGEQRTARARFRSQFPTLLPLP